MSNYAKNSIITIIIFLMLCFIKCSNISIILLITIIMGVILYIIDNIFLSNIIDCKNCKVEGFQNSVPDVYGNNVKVPDYMTSYIDYQKNGDETKDIEKSLQTSIFRYSNGEQSVVRPYLNDIYKYYADIYNRGVNNSLPNDLVKANLEYGQELNYLGPLNMGMSNREYTYIAPNNWNVVPNAPPVCVIDKKQKSIVYPVLMNSNSASFAPLSDFDRASRFTGNMQINTDYIKNVLNDPYV